MTRTCSQFYGFVLGGFLLGIIGCEGEVPAPDNNSQNPSETRSFVFADLEEASSLKLESKEGLPATELQFEEVKFRIAPGVLHVGSPIFPMYPPQIEGIPIGQRVSKLHFLQATQGGGFQQPGHTRHEEDGVQVGYYLVHYEDGTAEKIPLVYGEHLRDWWNWDNNRETPQARVAWTGETPSAKARGVSIRLYMMTWENPHPEKGVTHLDFVSDNAKPAPFCVSITGELVSQ